MKKYLNNQSKYLFKNLITPSIMDYLKSCFCWSSDQNTQLNMLLTRQKIIKANICIYVLKIKQNLQNFFASSLLSTQSCSSCKQIKQKKNLTLILWWWGRNQETKMFELSILGTFHSKGDSTGGGKEESPKLYSLCGQVV